MALRVGDWLHRGAVSVTPRSRRCIYLCNAATEPRAAVAPADTTEAESTVNAEEVEADQSMNKCGSSLQATPLANGEDAHVHRHAKRRQRRVSSSFRAKEHRQGLRGRELRRVQVSGQRKHVRDQGTSVAGDNAGEDAAANASRRDEAAFRNDTLEIAAQLGLRQSKRSQYNPAASDSGNAPMELAQFMHEIRSTDVLSAKQERQLAHSVRKYYDVEKERMQLESELRRSPSNGEVAASLGCFENELQQRIDQGKRAKRLMVEHNLRLVVSMAQKYKNRGIPLSDLIQEGTLGMLQAIDRFDPDRGFKFSTYCYWWIRRYLQAAVHDQPNTIRVPMNIQFRGVRVANARQKLNYEGKEPTYEALAQETGLTVPQVQDALNAYGYMSTLDNTTGDKDDEKYNFSNHGYDVQHMDSANNLEMAEEVTDKEQLSQDIEDLLVTLTPRERAVIRMRYCLDNRTEPASNKELAQMFGCSTEWIRRLESRALEKLASPERASHVSEHLAQRGLVLNDPDMAASVESQQAEEPFSQANGQSTGTSNTNRRNAESRRKQRLSRSNNSSTSQQPNKKRARKGRSKQLSSSEKAASAA